MTTKEQYAKQKAQKAADAAAVAVAEPEMSEKVLEVEETPQQESLIQKLLKGDPTADEQRKTTNAEVMATAHVPPVKQLFEQLGSTKGQTIGGMDGLDIRDEIPANATRERLTGEEREAKNMITIMYSKYLPLFSIQTVQDQKRALSKVSRMRFSDLRHLLQGLDTEVIKRECEVATSEKLAKENGDRVNPAVDYDFLEQLEIQFYEISP